MSVTMESQSETQVSRNQLFQQIDTLGELEPPCSIPAGFGMDDTLVEERGSGLVRSREQSPRRKRTAAEQEGDDENVSSTGQMQTVGDVPSASTASSDAPPAKKAKTKLTAEEKARRDATLAAEKAKKAQEKAAKDAEKARKDAEREAEKVRKEAEKAAEKQAKEAEKARKDAERAAKEAEKAAEKKQKEEAKQQREEAKMKKEEVKQKAERAQMRLGNFFTTTTTPKDEAKGHKTLISNKIRASLSPAPSNCSLDLAAASTPSKVKVSPYDALFPEFFVHKDVTVAPISRFSFDEEATKIISDKIDGALSEKSPITSLKLDPRQRFHVSGSRERGKKFRPVRAIMDDLTGNSRHPIDLTTESQHSQIKRSKDLLARIPVKYLKFQEDVRPPYIGTYTTRPQHGMQSLARNPFLKDLPDQNYDYDSEAEWVEDDEDAEDLKSENDEEEELDDGEEMAEFLDDENDELSLSRRLVTQGDLEPTSTGLCWEDRHKRTSNVKMMPYRMEIMIDHKLKSIDPLSTSYWEEPKAMAPPPRVPLSAITTNSKNPSVKSFFASTSDEKNPASAASASSESPKPAKMVQDEDMADFRAAIQGSPLTKVGLVDQLSKQFSKYTNKVVMETLMYVAHRDRKKGSVWELR